jgi:hypothetical protein
VVSLLTFRPLRLDLNSSFEPLRMFTTSRGTRWFKYDRDKLWLVYTQIVPVIFEPPCTSLWWGYFASYAEIRIKRPNSFSRSLHSSAAWTTIPFLVSSSSVRRLTTQKTEEFIATAAEAYDLARRNLYQSQSRHLREILSLLKIEPRFLGCLARSLLDVDIPTLTSRLERPLFSHGLMLEAN